MGRTVHELIESFGLERLSDTPNGYKACCAINEAHIDSKPSMYIHIDKGHVKCFSCGAYRPLFDFLIDNGATFDEAVEFLFLKHDKPESDKYEGITEYTLGRKLPKSFIDRGFLRQTLKNFKVGYDEYEDRITIPLYFRKILVGVQYRRFPKELWATEGFNKYNYIYNYEPTEERTYVEGFTDCWRAWQNGTEEVSAILGSSPSEVQLSLMSQHKTINLALDNDLAGYVGAFKINKAIGREIDIYIVPYAAEDVGECGETAWEIGMERKTTFTEFEVHLIQKKPKLYQKIQDRLAGKIESYG